ncbi:uncharacterized protein LOC122053317 [Zingiber officinale]|uniref:uncharacterized protein LOC122053317 n=1 Tax=Zingiber officinale TaxID=94328 RepID=UPI001C4BCEE0|nr:uncharacterized protein LOC122053317 [Zingiber officinale]
MLATVVATLGPLITDHSSQRLRYCSTFNGAAFLCIIFIIGTAYIATDSKEKMIGESPTRFANITQGILRTNTTYLESTQSDSCKSPCKSSGAESLPKGIISRISDMEMVPLWGAPEEKKDISSQKSLLAMAVGIKQKQTVDQIVMKFALSNYTIMLFHYDGIVDKWKDLQWSDSVLHVSAINQTKWWFAKRFLHPDIVAPYKYIFLWDEDLGVENFHPESYLTIVEKEGLEISQPALDPTKSSRVHHRITARQSHGDVHRRIFKFNGGGRCYRNSTAPPCTGWIEMMAPVFSRAAWRCVWHMIQGDLIHAWGLDLKLGYCVKGDRIKNIGVVDSEYIVHKAFPTLGGFDEQKKSPHKPTANDRFAVRLRSSIELEIFKTRWQEAVTEDNCWTDPYPD